MPRCIAHVVRFHPPICRNWGVHFFIKWLRDETKFAYEFFVCARHEWKISWEPLAGLRANDSNKPMSDSHMCVCFLQLFTRGRNIYFCIFFKAPVAENSLNEFLKTLDVSNFFVICFVDCMMKLFKSHDGLLRHATQLHNPVVQFSYTRKRNWISEPHASLLILLCPI